MDRAEVVLPSVAVNIQVKLKRIRKGEEDAGLEFPKLRKIASPMIPYRMIIWCSIFRLEAIG